jgi:hypothetical protein
VKEQPVHRVKLEPPTLRVVTDNLGKHPEIIGSGGGVWAYPRQRNVSRMASNCFQISPLRGSRDMPKKSAV